MKKLVFAIGLIGVFSLGSLAAIPGDGIHPSTGNAATIESASAPTGGSADRLKRINLEVSPDDAILDDWLCDGMTPCIELSPR
jgi:hypothetical protein